MRKRLWLLVAGAIVLVLGTLLGAALLAWPRVQLDSADLALARVSVPRLAGRVTAIEVRLATGELVPTQLRHGDLWPQGKLGAGESLTVQVTVRRPSWAGWLVGKTQRRSFGITTPSVQLLGRWLQVQPGSPVTVAFAAPVEMVALGRSPTRALPNPEAVVPVGVVASGSSSAGTIKVAASARPWERLSAPLKVSWFPARPYAQLLAEPRAEGRLAPGGPLTLTFSQPIQDVLGAARPRVSPSTPGHWRLLDAHTLAFQPSGFGFAFGEQVRLTLPVAVHLAGRPGTTLTRTLHWQVPQGSTLRLQQLLAQLGYLPLAWKPSRRAAQTLTAELAAAVSPPAGRFVWRYPRLRAMLGSLWQPGQYTVMVQGAVMAFEADHGLTTDGVADSQVWADLLRAVVHHETDRLPYDYIEVSEGSPETLSVWRNGRIAYTTPCNTGIAARPTAFGTFPVYARYLSTTMSGTNPDGRHYSDPGVPYVAYFNGGDAVHGFPRPGYGWPQSLGCVELPYAAAAAVFTYDPIGTLVGVS
jgi:lipoprotein-anchoring transpeptidase ErfK/SrfK